MFIRSSTAINNDRLIALDTIQVIDKIDSYTLKKLFPHREISEQKNIFLIFIIFKDTRWEEFYFEYKSEEDRDKAYEELCAFLNSNYKLRDFT
jgi:hypothetical protein